MNSLEGAAAERQDVGCASRVFQSHDRDAADIGAVLPSGPRLGVIGSSALWGKDSEAICASIGRALVTLQDLILLTGGVPGVGEAVGRAFWQHGGSERDKCPVYHILPRGTGSWDYGITLHVGDSMIDRREVLARLARVYLVAEGGPGTVHEARVARERRAIMIPIARTGGFAADLYSQIDCPFPELGKQWEHLADEALDPVELATSVSIIVQSALEAGT